MLLSYKGASLLHPSGIFKVLLFAATTVAELYFVYVFPTTPWSDLILEAVLRLSSFGLKEEGEGASTGTLTVAALSRVPFFTLFTLLFLWYVTLMVSIFAVLLSGKYDNANPRLMERGAGWVHRAKAANDNLLECMVQATLSVFVADRIGLNSVMAAKWCSLLILMRILHPIFYIFNLDYFRTVSFAVGFFSCCFIAGAALFPDSFLVVDEIGLP